MLCEVHNIEYRENKGCPKCWLKGLVKKWDEELKECRICNNKLNDHTSEQKRDCYKILLSHNGVVKDNSNNNIEKER